MKIDFKNEIFLLKDEELVDFLNLSLRGFKKEEAPEGVYFKKYKKAKLLFVSHRDTVQEPSGYVVFNNYIISSVLDNRLGMSLGIELAKDFPIDILITDDEEKGKSTIMFTPQSKLEKYNWIFSIDRRGEYPVTYHHYNKEAYKKLEKTFGNIERGSFSDISFIQNVFSVNFPAGHETDHNPINYANLKTVSNCLKKIKLFISENINTRYRDEERPITSWYDNYYHYYNYHKNKKWWLK